MATERPIKIEIHKSNSGNRLTAAEIAKLWATYTGNSMSNCILTYFLQHVDDNDIKVLLENALSLTDDFMSRIKDIFMKENFPVPIGFSKEDINLNAPRLYEDEFYVHYLKYASKAGLSIYNVAIQLMYREDVKDFFHYSIHSTLTLLEQIKGILMEKGLIIKPPNIPIPDKVEFVKQDFLNGYFGHVRPLHGLEIAHLYDNIENNVTSKALVLGFSQVTKRDDIREFFRRGKDIANKAVERYTQQLHNENLPSPSYIDHLVTTSTISPFSDKIMLFHKVDMFSMKIRAFGNSVAVSGRHDIGLMYMRTLMNITFFVEDGVKIMIENGWMEKPPGAVNRDELAAN